MKKHILVFSLEETFEEDFQISANNELDMRQYLEDKGYKEIAFCDIDRPHGTCSLKDMYGRKTAKCFYVEKI